jgi:hypothetical protein
MNHTVTAVAADLITIAPGFIAGGLSFPTRALAQAHLDTVARKARLLAAGFSEDFSVAAADRAAEVVAALTLPSRMGRKPKAPAVAAA